MLATMPCHRSGAIAGPPLVRFPAVADRVLFFALSVAWGVGVALAVRRLPPLVPPAANTAWVERYGALRPVLAGATTAYFVGDFQGAKKHRLHRAQFELAPCVLEPRPTVAGVPIADLAQQPLILDFQTARRLEAALAHLATRAESRKTRLEVTRFPEFLAVVTVRTPS